MIHIQTYGSQIQLTGVLSSQQLREAKQQPIFSLAFSAGLTPAGSASTGALSLPGPAFLAAPPDAFSKGLQGSAQGVLVGLLLPAKSEITGSGPTAAVSGQASAQWFQSAALFVFGMPSDPQLGSLKSFATVPEVSGQPGDWARQSEVIAGRLVGDSSRIDAVSYKGENPWATSNAELKDERVAVSWAMWKNPNVKYDVNRKMFFVEDTAGNRKDVASLQEVQNAAKQAGGLRPENAGPGGSAVERLLESRVQGATAESKPSGGPLNSLELMLGILQVSMLQMCQSLRR